MTQTAHSHLPVLQELLAPGEIKSVFEFGMGDGSTGLFLDKCEHVISVEMQNVEWFSKLTKRWAGSKWAPVLRLGPDASWDGAVKYDLVFVDGHGESRPEQIQTAMKMSDLVVVHDTQEPGYKWERIKDHIPPGWTWTDDKRHPTWTSILRKEADDFGTKEYIDRYLASKGCTVNVRQTTNLRTLNLGITNQCNLACTTCNRFIESAPSDDMMTLDQVTRFVDESLELSWPWEEIVVYGGEPAIHPNYVSICHQVLRLREAIPGVTLKVVTNGKGKRINAALDRTPEGFQIMRSTGLKDTVQRINGKSVIPEFGNVLQAPCDRVTGEILDCQIHATCGLELTPYGYLPCACGGARVMGLNVFFKRLQDITVEECKDRLETLCGVCGRNLNYEIKCKETTEPSEFWRMALDRYARKIPDMGRY